MQIGSTQIGSIQLGFTQDGFTQDGSIQVGFMQLGSIQDGSMQVGSTQVSFTQVAPFRSAPSKSIIFMPLSIRPDSCKNWSTPLLRSLSKRGSTVSVRTRAIFRTSSSGADSRNGWSLSSSSSDILSM